MRRYTRLSLGVTSATTRSAWQADPRIAGQVTFDKATPMGSRLGRRVLGIGLDSFVLASIVRMRRVRGPLLCANPWIGVALRGVGRRDFVVTGIYAEPGSRSFALLRRAIGPRPVVTLSEFEADAWRQAGGQALPVLYGNTFNYPFDARRGLPGRPRIFVGGTSDRDGALLESLIREIKVEGARVELIVADGTGPDEWSEGESSIRFLPRLSNAEFGTIMSDCNIVFMPIASNKRAAGHMVTVGALECGLAVLTSESEGMRGYVDGMVVRNLDRSRSLIAQLLTAAMADTPARRDEIRDFWRANFSLDGHVKRVMDALDVMTLQP